MTPDKKFNAWVYHVNGGQEAVGLLMMASQDENAKVPPDIVRALRLAYDAGRTHQLQDDEAVARAGAMKRLEFDTGRSIERVQAVCRHHDPKGIAARAAGKSGNSTGSAE